jgi:hypothetical protein
MLGVKKNSRNPLIINNLMITGLFCFSLTTCAAIAQTTTAGYGSSSVKTQAQKETSANLPSSYKAGSPHVAALRAHKSLGFPNHGSMRINHPWGLTPAVNAEQTKPKRLPETEKLLQNDSLLPGQNRTQAMILESQTGHINPQEDSILAPKKNINNQHKANK